MSTNFAQKIVHRTNLTSQGCQTDLNSRPRYAFAKRVFLCLKRAKSLQIVLMFIMGLNQLLSRLVDKV